MNDSELAVYRICRVLFGVSSSPFLLSGTIIGHVHKLEDQNFAKKLLKSLHVDDLCPGGDTITEVIYFYELSRQLLADASFNLPKFESKCSEVEIMLELPQ